MCIMDNVYAIILFLDTAYSGLSHQSPLSRIITRKNDVNNNGTPFQLPAASRISPKAVRMPTVRPVPLKLGLNSTLQNKVSGIWLNDAKAGI